MNLTLFELDSQYLALMDRIENNDGEITHDIEAELKQVETDMIKKQDGYVKIMSNFDSVIEQADGWIKKMQQKKQVLKNQQQRLKDRMMEHMEIIGTKEIVGELGKVKIMESERLVDIDVDSLSNEFKKIETVITPRKAEIKKAMKAGENLPAKLVKSQYLQIF